MGLFGILTSPAYSQAPVLSGLDARSQPQRWVRDDEPETRSRPRVEVRFDNVMAVQRGLSPEQSLTINQIDVINPGMQVTAGDIDQALDNILSAQRDAAIAQITMGEALQAAEDVVAIHRQQGYALAFARLDERALQGGDLRIVVQSPGLANVYVGPGLASSSSILQSALSDLVGQAVNTRQLEDRVDGLIANNMITSSLILSISENQAGLASVSITEQRPTTALEWRATVTTDRSPALGPIRSAARVKMTDLAIVGDEYAIEAGRGDGFDDWILSANMPLNDHGLELYGSGFLLEGRLIELPLRDLNITNSIQSWTLGASSPVSGFRLPGLSDSVDLTLGVEINFKRTELLEAGAPLSVQPGAVDGVTRYSAIRFLQELEYDSGPTHIELRSKLSLGLDALSDDSAALPVPDENFLHWYGEFEFERELTPGTIRARVAGQYADEPLFGPEQYTLGGMYSVRGFRAHTIFADSAVFGTLEYEHPLAVETVQSDNWLNAASLIVFVDGGRAKLAIEPQPAVRELFSVGLGAEIELDPGLTLSAYWAEQLRTGPDRVDTNFQDDGFGFRIVLER